ncbi:hypothetical protein E4U26_002585 [Claviceps purpurea]|nr:hypothetical protein E4U26_002585 [Claviceps purpurea]
MQHMQPPSSETLPRLPTGPAMYMYGRLGVNLSFSARAGWALLLPPIELAISPAPDPESGTRVRAQTTR